MRFGILYDLVQLKEIVQFCDLDDFSYNIRGILRNEHISKYTFLYTEKELLDFKQKYPDSFIVSFDYQSNIVNKSLVDFQFSTRMGTRYPIIMSEQNFIQTIKQNLYD